MVRDFGSDKFTTRVILEIVLVVIGLGIFGWLTINSLLKDTAQIFWIFGIMGLLGILAAFVIKGPGKSDIFDVAIAEKSMIPVNRKVLYLVFGGLFLFTFFLLANSDYRIAAPSFQLIELGLVGDSLLTIFAAIMEDIFFFALVPGMVFSLMYWITKNFWASLAVVITICPFVFMMYHIGVYGFQNEAAMLFVYVFGVEMTAMMIILRDITYAHVRHIGNNMGIMTFQQMSLETFFITMLSSVWFWLAAIIIAGASFLKLRK